MDFITSVSPVTQASSMELGDSYRKTSVQNGQSPQGTNRHVGAGEMLLTGCGSSHGEGRLVGGAVFIPVLLWMCAFVGLWPWRVGRGTRWHGQSWGDFSHYEGKSFSVINKAYTRIKKLF